MNRTFTKVVPRLASKVNNLKPGLRYAYYEGEWDSLPDFSKLNSVKNGMVANIDFSAQKQVEYFGFTYDGYINIPQNGVYAFYTDSDDGSRLFLDGELIVDNDGLHGLHEEKGVVALAEGYHSFTVTFFEKTGGDDLIVSIIGPGIEKQAVPVNMIFYKNSGIE